MEVLQRPPRSRLQTSGAGDGSGQKQPRRHRVRGAASADSYV